MSAALKMKSGPFSAADDALIRDFGGTLRELADALGRDAGEVSKRRLRLAGVARYWLPEEEALIQANDRPLEEVAQLLGRPVQNIKNRRHALGLGGRPTHASAGLPWSREERLCRPCLRCGRLHTSTRFIRVCDDCKASVDWA